MEIFKQALNSTSSIIFLAIILILAILYSFSGIFFGLDFTDSFYHLNQALNPADGIYLFPFYLSSVIIKGFIELVGPNIINLRVVNWLLLVTSMILPFIFFKVNSRRSVIIIYFIFTLILYTPFNANILGYDTLSIFINTLLFTFTALYLKERKNYLIILLSIIGAMAVMIRLPNILAIPVIFIFILISERIYFEKWKVKNFLKPGVFLISTFVLTAIGFSIYYSSWEQFYNASSNAESHNLFSLFINYFRDAVKIGGFVVLLLLGLFAYQSFTERKVNLLKDGIIMFFFFITIYFLVGISKFATNYSLFLVATAITLVAFQKANYNGGKYSFRRLILYLFLFFIFINPLGSNTGLLKAYSLLLLLPFVLSLHEIKYRNYWLILFTVLIPFSIMTKFFTVYEDKNILALNEKMEIRELFPIHTNFKRKEYIEKTDVLVQELNSHGVEVFFYGDKSHIFHYLYPKTSLNISSFFQPVDNLKFFKEFQENLKNRDEVAVFVINTYPENLQSETKNLVELELIKYGFEEVNNNDIKYFLRTGKKDNY